MIRSFSSHTFARCEAAPRLSATLDGWLSARRATRRARPVKCRLNSVGCTVGFNPMEALA